MTTQYSPGGAMSDTPRPITERHVSTIEEIRKAAAMYDREWTAREVNNHSKSLSEIEANLRSQSEGRAVLIDVQEIESLIRLINQVLPRHQGVGFEYVIAELRRWLSVSTPQSPKTADGSHTGESQ